MTQKDIIECLRCNGRMNCKEIAVKTGCDVNMTFANLCVLVSKDIVAREKENGETYYELLETI